MARPKADLASAEAVLALADGEGRIAVRVTPGARSEAVTVEGGRVQVRVRARPEDGKATAAAMALVAEALGLAGSRVELVRGATSREKMFRIRREG